MLLPLLCGILKRGNDKCTDPARVADPDPALQIRIQLFTSMRIQIQLFTLMRIRIQLFTLVRIRIKLFTSMRNLLLIEVLGIFDPWSIDPTELRFEPPGLHF
jgi:hypothetical protein